MLLVVEDNPHFSNVMSNILSRRGYTFDIVDRGTEAIARILHHGEKYAVVILDLRLPDMSSDEIIASIRSIGDEAKSLVPLVVMTGADLVPPSLIQSGNICTVLYKPFLVSDLLRAISQCARWEPKKSQEDLSVDVSLGEDVETNEQHDHE